MPAMIITARLITVEFRVERSNPVVIARLAPDNRRMASNGTNAISPPMAPVSSGRWVGPAVFPWARMYCQNEISFAISVHLQKVGSREERFIAVHPYEMPVSQR